MADRRWCLTGVAGVVLYLVAQGFTGLMPDPDSMAVDVVDHFRHHHNGVLVGAAIGSVAALFLLVFADRLRRAMDEAEGGESPLAVPTLIAWAILFTVIVSGQLPLLALALQDNLAGNPDLVTISFDVYNLSLYAGSAAFAALSILGPIVVARRTGFLPRWLIGVGVVEVLVNVVELAGISTRSGKNTDGYAFGLGPIVWMIWVAGASIVLYQRADDA